MHSVAWRFPSKKLSGVWKTFDNSSGLLGGVTWLMQDANGLLWLATYGAGVASYDGVQFRYYTTEDGLESNNVRRLCQDRDGRVWCKTWDDHIHSFDGARFVYHAHARSDPPLAVMGVDHEGVLWFGSRNAGIYRFNGKRFVAHVADNDPIDGEVWAVHRDRQGRFWLGTRAGARCYDGKRWRTWAARDGLIHSNVRAFCEDTQGRMWFGTEAGLACYDGRSVVNYTTKDGLAHNEIWGLFCDRMDRIWIGAFGGGITCFDGEDFVVYTPDDGLLEESCDCIIQDVEGSFWFAHATTGLSRFEPEFFQPICTDPVSQGGFAQDPEGRLWYGAFYQLGCADGTTVTRRRLSAQVTAVCPDSSGGLWVGTWGEGLYHYPDRQKVWNDEPALVTREHGLSDLRILALTEDREGRIWAGAENGDIGYWDGHGFRHAFRHPGPVSVIRQDHRGRIWAGSWARGGLSCYDHDKGGVRRYTKEDGLPEDAVRWILEAKDRKLWICTLGGGIACFDGKRFKRYSFAEGMWSANTAFVYEAANGHLWIGSQGGGVHRYDGNNFQILTRQDGLLSSTVSAIAQQADGAMVFATKRGIVRYPLVEEDQPIQVSHFSARVAQGEPLVQELVAGQEGYTEAVNRFRRQFVEAVLRECGYNRTEAAKRLGMHRPNLIALIKKLGIMTSK